jgi:calreticulin
MAVYEEWSSRELMYVCQGVWRPKQIPNPAYKGQWVHPNIDNPEYKPDANLYRYTDIAGLGFDLWQVKSGTIFDNILITDDEQVASDRATQLWSQTKVRPTIVATSIVTSVCLV